MALSNKAIAVLSGLPKEVTHYYSGQQSGWLPFNWYSKALKEIEEAKKQIREET